MLPRTAVVNGRGVLVNVPDPARYALHNLIVAGERPGDIRTAWGGSNEIVETCSRTPYT
ncbi:MAG: GSU2403 family nucleotidyltransferase fold protein [Candidatus Methylomirabilia bacterium]